MTWYQRYSNLERNQVHFQCKGVGEIAGLWPLHCTQEVCGLHKACRNVTHSLTDVPYRQRNSHVDMFESESGSAWVNRTHTHLLAWTLSRKNRISPGRTEDTCKSARVRSNQTRFLDRLKREEQSDVETVKDSFFKFLFPLLYRAIDQDI